MNKLMKRITSLSATLLLAVSAGMFVLSGTAKAIPWDPNTTGLNHPGFNIFTGVPDVGNEADFVRGHVAGSSTPYVDPVNDACANGTEFGIRVYVHNAANQTLNNNGTGPGVAKNTKVRVSLPATTANPITGVITANNAATDTDTLTINCSGEDMQLTYVNNSAIQQHIDGSTNPLSNDIVTSGALIGTKQPNGDVWGCFNQRVLVFLKVKVVKKEVPKLPAVCKDIVVETKDGRVATVKSVAFNSNDATVNKVRINWGDGTIEEFNNGDFPKSHTYKEDGTFNIRATLLTNKGEVSSSDCVHTVTFKSKKPVTPPEQPKVLVSTGAGTTGLAAGAFIGTSVLGTVLHRRWTLKKAIK